MRGLAKIAEAVGHLRDRVQAVGRRRFALGTPEAVVECIAGLEQHRAPGDSPLWEAIDRSLAEAADADAALPGVAVRVLAAHVVGMILCPGGERLRGALLRCLAASREGRRAYRAAEMELRAAIGEVDSETWRRGHGGAGTTLGIACGILAELTPEGSAKREAEAAAFARAVRTVGPAAPVAVRPAPAPALTSEPVAPALAAVESEPAKGDDREEAAREVRRAARRPSLSGDAGWRPLSSIQELQEWVQW